MFKQMTKIIELLIEEEGGAVLESISLVDRPAVEVDFQFFDKAKTHTFSIEDEDQRIVIGPAMIPNIRIPRVDKKTGEVYGVFFSEETIAKAAELFLKLDRASHQNTDHQDNWSNDLYVMESWIKEDTFDKSNKYGFRKTPIGTWFVKMRILDDVVWEGVKDGTFKGLSVQGDFLSGDEHHESMLFNRTDYSHLYSELKDPKDKLKLDSIIRLLILEEKKGK